MCPQYILSDNGTEFKNNLMDQVLQQLGVDRIFSAPYHPQSNGKLEVSHKYLKPTLKKLCENDPANWDKCINEVLASYRITPSYCRVTILSSLQQSSQFTTSPATRTNAMFSGRS